MVGYLGNSAENDLQWRNVYSKDGGKYSMNISFITGENRNFKIVVNDEEPIATTVNSGGWSTVGSRDYNIVLKKGNNVIRIYEDKGWMPDIDCMKLTLLEPLAVESTPAAEALNLRVENGGIVVSVGKPTKVTVVDLLGRLIYEEMLASSKKIELKNGIYIVNGVEVMVK